MRFREIIISGTPEERGFAHGKALSSEIEITIDYYRTIFKKSSAEIFRLANHFRKVIHEFNPAYCDEIEGIAAGAGVQEPLWIYALNSRSEILALEASTPRNECTAICFQSTALLGQTWDWGSPLERLAVLMQIRISEDHIIQMLTEPGIIGKIGLNSHGIGACLNILTISKPLDGVPIHIVLRSILESKTLDEAMIAIQKSGFGKASNILFGDHSGNFYTAEFAGDESFFIQGEGPFMVHTNHYLAQPINPNDEQFCSSYTRLRMANEKASALRKFTMDEMKTILSDRSDPDNPIWRTYQPDDEINDLGTVATIVMDLRARQLHIRKGNFKRLPKNRDKFANHSMTKSHVDDFAIAFEGGYNQSERY